MFWISDERCFGSRGVCFGSRGTMFWIHLVIGLGQDWSNCKSYRYLSEEKLIPLKSGIYAKYINLYHFSTQCPFKLFA